MPSNEVQVGNLIIANHLPFTLIAGPCQLESHAHASIIAGILKAICLRLKLPFVFKASFDKANRTSIKGKRGLGLDQSIEVFRSIRDTFAVPVMTDVHEPWQCERLADVVDVLQIPAFLCRQTDLLLAAAKTGKTVNIKKGQFVAPWDMQNAVDKIGHGNVMLTERGATFGYNNLVADMRSLPIMARTGCPVIFDATHSVQQPGGLGGASGGDRAMVPVLARAAVGAGVAGVFIETHDDPDKAPSDGPCMVPLNEMDALLQKLMAIDAVVKQ